MNVQYEETYKGHEIKIGVVHSRASGSPLPGKHPSGQLLNTKLVIQIDGKDVTDRVRRAVPKASTIEPWIETAKGIIDQMDQSNQSAQSGQTDQD